MRPILATLADPMTLARVSAHSNLPLPPKSPAPELAAGSPIGPAAEGHYPGWRRRGWHDNRGRGRWGGGIANW